MFTCLVDQETLNFDMPCPKSLDRPLGNWWDNENANGLVCSGKCSPENPVLFMGKSMVSGEDFPTQTIENDASVKKIVQRKNIRKNDQLRSQAA